MASLESLCDDVKLEIVSHINDISTLLSLKSTTKHWYEVIQEMCPRVEDKLTTGLRLLTTITASHGVNIYHYQDWHTQNRFRYIFHFSFSGTEFYCPINMYIDDAWWVKIRNGDHTAIDQAFAEMDRGLHAIYAEAIGLDEVSYQRTFRERRNFWTAFWRSAEADGRLEGHHHPGRPVLGAIRAQISGAEDVHWLLAALTVRMMASPIPGSWARGVQILGRERGGFPELSGSNSVPA